MTVPAKWIIAQYWFASPDRSTFAPELESLDAPCCFACGWFSERWEGPVPKGSWERAKLERAHIVPASLGGPDDASNIILLCAPCHQDSPDWHEPDAMAQWIAERPERSTRELEGLGEWLAAEQRVPQFRALLDLLAMGTDAPELAAQDVIAALRESVGNAGTHGTSLSPGTKVVILRDAADRALAPLVAFSNSASGAPPPLAS